MVQDLNSQPIYSMREVAQYLQIPITTLRSWTSGVNPLIKMADPETKSLSFLNIIEAHVLSSLRRDEVKMSRIRPAIDYLAKVLKTEHPLAHIQLETDSIDIFIKQSNDYLNISKSGQMAIKEALKDYLKMVRRDEKGNPVRLFPLDTRGRDQEETVFIDPKVCFGRMVIKEQGIPVDALSERLDAGDTLEELSEDYGIEKEVIKRAIIRFAA